MRETEKVERLGFAEAPVCASLDRIAAELDHARFIWVQYQRKLYQPLAQIRQKSLGLIPVFKRYCSRQKGWLRLLGQISSWDKWIWLGGW